MATLRALEIDNCLIEIDGPEVPVMDGSADAFIDAIDQAGVEHLSATRRYIRVEKAVRVEMGSSFAELPHDGRRIEVEIDFANPLIGRQRFATEITPDIFRGEIARARTFGFLADVEACGPAASPSAPRSRTPSSSATTKVMNPEGLRFDDEFVRHRRSTPSATSASPAPPSSAATAPIAAATASTSRPSTPSSPIARPGAMSRCRPAARAAMPTCRPASPPRPSARTFPARPPAARAAG